MRTIAVALLALALTPAQDAFIREQFHAAADLEGHELAMAIERVSACDVAITVRFPPSEGGGVFELLAEVDSAGCIVDVRSIVKNRIIVGPFNPGTFPAGDCA